MRFSLFLNKGAGADSRSSANPTSRKLRVEAQRAMEVIQAWEGYEITPLRHLPGLARKLGVGSLAIKDEAGRFGLGSFKALGGAYAIARLLVDRVSKATGKEATVADLLNQEGSSFASNLTVCCATDGNHGRSVAWGARMFGCACVIFVHRAVSDERKRLIEHYGARVIVTNGNYDDSVREAQRTAQDEGWTVVSDTSYEGYIDIPLDVMAGYSVMAREAVTQWQELPPTHVFLQTGVGSMAASVAVQLAQAYGGHRPRIILVDPANAACWYESLKAGTPTVVGGDLETIMAGLACGEVSQLAWEILSQTVDAVIAVDDNAAADSMRWLAEGTENDPPMVAGESGVGGLAGFLALAADVEARGQLGVTPESRLLFFSTEGATDVQMYQDIVGRAPGEVSL